MDRPLIIINSHPIQYFAPFYKYCCDRGLNLQVWYCSDESIVGKVDAQFGVNVKWDLPLLEGYPYRFFKNFSPVKGIHKGFFGLMNLGMARALWKAKKSVVIIHGWNYFSSVYAFWIAKLFGHRVCLRAETPWIQDRSTGVFATFRHTILKAFFLKAVFRCLYIGTQNRLFYESYGVQGKRLLFVPYSVDNARFQSSAQKLLPKRLQLLEELGISDCFVVIFSGKFIEKKRPLLLLEAFHQMNVSRKALIMVGDGELKRRMEQYVESHQVKNVIFPGFVNQTQIGVWYAIGDVFVMCSGDGETWGLSVNEAMNFSLPIIVSDRVGCVDDLVRDDENGYVVKLDDTLGLKKALERLAIKSAADRRAMGRRSLERVNLYSYATAYDGLRRLAFNQGL